MEPITLPFALLAPLLPAVCGLSYGIILIFDRENRSKRMLGIILIVGGLCWGNSLIMDNLYAVDNRVTVFNTWHILSDLMLWPVIRWYAILIVRPDARFFPDYPKHFIPFFAGLVCALSLRAIRGAAPDVYSMKEFFSLLWEHPEFVLRLILLAVFIGQTTMFFIRSVRDLKEYRTRIENDFSEVDDMDLRWVYWVIYIFFLFPVFNLALAFSGDTQIRMYIALWAFVCHTIIAILGGTHKNIYYLPDPDLSLDKQLLHPGKMALFISPALEVPGINQQTYSNIRDGLIRLMEDEGVYTKQDLRLDDLAALLHTNKTYVSAVINDYYQTNFYTLVNRYRVHKAQALLLGKRQIKEVWILAGFNSQRSFNMVFKQFSGVTPSEWVIRGRES